MNLLLGNKIEGKLANFQRFIWWCQCPHCCSISWSRVSQEKKKLLKNPTWDPKQQKIFFFCLKRPKSWTAFLGRFLNCSSFDWTIQLPISMTSNGNHLLLNFTTHTLINNRVDKLFDFFFINLIGFSAGEIYQHEYMYHIVITISKIAECSSFMHEI